MPNPEVPIADDGVGYGSPTRLARKKPVSDPRLRGVLTLKPQLGGDRL